VARVTALYVVLAVVALLAGGAEICEIARVNDQMNGRREDDAVVGHIEPVADPRRVA